MRVQLNGTTVPANDTNGWLFEPGYAAITLVGSSCDQLRNSPGHSITVLYGCPPGPPLP